MKEDIKDTYSNTAKLIPDSTVSHNSDVIEVGGARVHNLKNINVTMPHNSLIVVTGLSGSGKSSLAFDTIFAEGQRRYIETFSSYARNMMGSIERPDVDYITGLSPVISIEQKTTNRNPRSTIGTTTEIYDFFRLMFARLGEARSYLSGEVMVKYTKDKIVDLIVNKYEGRRTYILAPLVKNRKGHYKDLFENLLKKGYMRVRVDGEIRELANGMKLDRYRNHSVELVIDRLKVSASDIDRLRSTIDNALRQGGRQLMVYDVESETISHYSLSLMDIATGLSYPEPAPHDFSFNSPQGACRRCKGLGVVSVVDEEKVFPDKSKSIYEGGIAPLGKYKNSLVFWQIQAILKLYNADIKTPISELPSDAINDILQGVDVRLHIDNATLSTSRIDTTYDGLVKYIEMQQSEDAAPKPISGVANIFQSVYVRNVVVSG